MRALVTGGAGFIGSHLVDRLLDGGQHVTVVDDLSTGTLDRLPAGHPRLEVLIADIADPQTSERIAVSRPEIVFHLAAQIDVRASVADPLADARVNVLGTLNVLEACRRAGTDKLCFTTSGGCIYGEPDPADLPVAEDYPGHPHSPYGASKRGVEEYLHSYQALYGLRWTSLALANVFGPRQDPGGEAGVVSIFAGRMLAGEPVTIYGDGEQTRDFVYVADVVSAFLAAADRGDGLRCNIGTGQETSVRKLHSELAALTGASTQPAHAPARHGELHRIALDAGLARRALGWAPAWSLQQGLTATADWVRAGTMR